MSTQRNCLLILTTKNGKITFFRKERRRIKRDFNPTFIKNNNINKYIK